MSKTLLIDMDGVLRSGDKILSGCEEFLNFVRAEKFNSCIISNTTRYTSQSIKDFFTENRIELGEIQIITALDATINHVKEHYTSAAVYCMPEALKAFGTAHNPESKEAVVIGDMGDLWNYEVMNEIFRKVQSGADLIAMQRNKYWKLPTGELALDAGPFIKGIEYATDQDALLLGKPSPIFFEAAINKCGGNTDDFYMLGDDLFSDVKAAEDMGGKGILILTGKTTEAQLHKATYTPSLIAKNLQQAQTFLQ